MVPLRCAEPLFVNLNIETLTSLHMPILPLVNECILQRRALGKCWHVEVTMLIERMVTAAAAVLPITRRLRHVIFGTNGDPCISSLTAGPLLSSPSSQSHSLRYFVYTIVQIRLTIGARP